jgi:hypothetical protein
LKTIINIRAMKRVPFILLLATIIFAVTPACKKSSGGSTEANLVVEITPAAGTTEAPAPGPDFPLKVEVKSTMPPSGVKIEVSAKKDGSGDPAFFTSTKNSSGAQNNYTITGTPATVICIVSVTVTSLSKPSNVWTGSYRYSKK